MHNNIPEEADAVLRPTLMYGQTQDHRTLGLLDNGRHGNPWRIMMQIGQAVALSSGAAFVDMSAMCDLSEGSTVNVKGPVACTDWPLDGQLHKSEAQRSRLVKNRRAMGSQAMHNPADDGFTMHGGLSNLRESESLSVLDVMGACKTDYR